MKRNEFSLVMVVFLFFGGMTACQGSLGGEDVETDGVEVDGVDAADVGVDSDMDVDVDREISPLCGNGVVNEGEECDPAFLASRSCTASCGSEGTQVCTSLCAWDECVPPDEICNGVDDDCDGLADNGFECARGSTDVCFPYCESEAVRTCDNDCSWGDCEIPGITCNQIIVPYMEDPVPAGVTIVASTPIQKADVYFILDSTGSMIDEIDRMRASFSSEIVPGIMDVIPDVWFGVMQFQDCPWDCGDSSIENLQNLTGDRLAVEAVLASMTDWCGGWEPYTLALYVTATGDGSAWGMPPRTCLDPSAMIGYPCFRDGSLPVLIQVGDEDFQDGISNCLPSISISQAVDAINGINGKYVGINSGDSYTDMAAVAAGTGSIDMEGDPLVFNVPDGGLGIGGHIVDAVTHLFSQGSLVVTAAVRDDGADDIDASIFIDRIEPNTTDSMEDPDNPGVFCVTGLPTADVSGDGHDDTFTSVAPATAVCFDVIPAGNETVPSSADPRICRVFIDIIADGITLLDTEEIYFIIP